MTPALDQSRRGQRGAALVIVLWTALLLSTVMAGALAKARIEARIAAARTENFRAGEASRSALDLAAWRVAVGAHEGGGSAPILSGFEQNGYQVVVEFSPEGEKLDLNLASADVLREFFAAVGVGAEQAATLAAQIADWRDADDLARPNGAERRDYANKRGKYIGDRPFNAIEELNAVLAVDEKLFDHVAAALTVFGSGDMPSAHAFEKIGVRHAGVQDAGHRARLGTRSKGAAAGRRFVLIAKATKEDGMLAPQHQSMAFRVTGEAVNPVERISLASSD